MNRINKDTNLPVMKSFIKNAVLFIHNSISNSRKINREIFLKEMDRSGDILEIGPFTNPSLRGKNIFYFDVLNKSDLIKRAEVEKYTITDIPEINFVSANGDLGIVKKNFDNVYSSHCIEHQPNLVKHLLDVNNILKSGGKYYLVIPDKRYCFDALLPETNIAHVLEAFQKNRTKHTLANVIQHGALTAHHSPYRHWLGDHGLINNIPDKIESVLQLYEKSNEGYIDVHAWRFTPTSFVRTIDLLYEMQYINLSVDKVFSTVMFTNEFYVVLQKVDR